jgi:hypothetical protein
MCCSIDDGLRGRYPGYSTHGYGYGMADAGSSVHHNSSQAYGPAMVEQNAVISTALDATQRKIWFAVNGEWLEGGDPAEGANPSLTMFDTVGPLYPAAGVACGHVAVRISANFGRNPFVYAPPDGYRALQVTECACASDFAACMQQQHRGCNSSNSTDQILGKCFESGCNVSQCGVAPVFDFAWRCPVPKPLECAKANLECTTQGRGVCACQSEMLRCMSSSSCQLDTNASQQFAAQCVSDGCSIKQCSMPAASCHAARIVCTERYLRCGGGCACTAELYSCMLDEGCTANEAHAEHVQACRDNSCLPHECGLGDNATIVCDANSVSCAEKLAQCMQTRREPLVDQCTLSYRGYVLLPLGRPEFSPFCSPIHQALLYEHLFDATLCFEHLHGHSC